MFEFQLLVTEIENPSAIKNMEAADNVVMIEGMMTEDVVAIEAVLVVVVEKDVR